MENLVRVIILFLIPLIIQGSLPSDPVYKAGIVEFIPAKNGTAKENVKNNVQRAKDLIESSETADLDILVFPEYALNSMDWKTYIPDPILKIAPCDIPDYDFSLVQLSCAARSRKLYLVINVVEKANSGQNTYNTNVVFDRAGRVISRYRKTHLYGNEWYSTDVTDNIELATFSTDFGVVFAHFICFDMMFYDPAMVLIKNMNITDIVYPTYWFSELPFLTAVQLQEGWAYANNVNLLAADASVPSGQNTGSGIFAGKLGRLAAIIHEEPTTKLLKANVPKRGFHYEMPPITVPQFVPQFETYRFTKLSLLRDYNVDIFETKLLSEDFKNITETICHINFCCSFTIQRSFIGESEKHSAYRFRLAVYSGNQTTIQGKDQSDLSICALIACTNDQLYSCGHIFPGNVLVGNKYYFTKIDINGNFAKAKKRVIMPSTVDGKIMPLPVPMWEMIETERVQATEVTISLKSPVSDLLTFGIWANYYSDIKNKHNLDHLHLNKHAHSGSVINRAFISYILFCQALLVFSSFMFSQ